jgi:hypothetical protein
MWLTLRAASFSPAVLLASDETAARRWCGAASCAATACHNGGGPPGTRGSEYTIWATRDPHARAFSVLYSERSRIIERNRLGLNDLEQAHPESDLFCLRCHAPGGAAESGAAASDGVGCEACHGPAGSWRTVHYLAEWRELDRPARERLGMRDTRALLPRVRLCVSCHVGSSEASVDHDLIASGHPRLRFEFASYHAVMPRHWSDRDDKKTVPDLEARGWAVGQFLAASAALGLLGDRAATNAHQPAPWPELAAHDCFACHHELGGAASAAPERVGRLVMNAWYFAMLEPASRLGGTNRVLDVDELSALGAAMTEPSAKRQRIGAFATRLSGEFQSAAARMVHTPALDAAGLQAALGQIASARGTGWDTDAQRYLSLAAIYRAEGDLFPAIRAKELRAPIETLGEEVHVSLAAPARYKGRYQEALEVIRARAR